MERELYKMAVKFLKQFLIQADWDDVNVPEQARAVFTTICLAGDMNADTIKCDDLLMRLYPMLPTNSAELTYEEFENFMLEWIV